MDLTTDTEIYAAREYFIREKDKEKQALACFYAAKVAFSNGQADRATLYFQEASDFAQKSGNKVLQGRALYNIGYLCYDRELPIDTITRYQQALQLFQQAEDQYQMEIYSLNAIGNALLIREHTDSARYYYQTALNRALLHGDTASQVMVYTTLGVAYREQGQPDTATFYCRKALSMANANSEKAYVYRNLAHLFLGKDVDSARYYLANAEPLYRQLDNRFAIVSLTHLYYQVEKAGGNFPKALDYLEFRIAKNGK